MIINEPGSGLVDQRALKIMQALDSVEIGMTGRQIAKVAQMPKTQTLVSLNHLVKSGTLKAANLGSAITYWPNRQHFYWQIFNTVQSFQDQLKEKLIQIFPQELREPGNHAALFLFGSVVRNQSNLNSDIDLGIVVPDALTYLNVEHRIKTMRPGIEDFTGNELSPILITWDTFVRMTVKHDPLTISWDNEGEHIAGEHIQDLRSIILIDSAEEGVYA